MIQDELPKSAQRRLDAFKRAGRRFCGGESCEPVSKVAVGLPVPGLDIPDASAHMTDYYRARELLEPRFAGHDFYQKTFDAYSPDPSLRDQVTASLTDDLAEIYAFIKDEHRNDKAPGDEREPPYLRLWQWKFSYDEHAAVYHILPALTAITTLLRGYWDDDDGWSDVWQPEPLPSVAPGDEERS